ncbi:hypothetical protein EI94DRAFT_1786730 [Lactarius quietus]|nr:hypothetical protein EI94DRAFT_1786730 [Lactarius quietus]
MRHVGDDNPTHYEDAQGTLTLWFHENKDKDGNISDKVYGVSNCHVLRKDTTAEYEKRDGTPKDHVRVCGMRRFQQGLDEIKGVIGDHGLLADFRARQIAKLRVKERQDAENAKAIRANRRNLEVENEAIADLEAFYDEITKYCNIGYVKYAAPMTVDVEGGTLSKYSLAEITKMFYPSSAGATTFKFPEERKLRIEGCATKEDLANPAGFDSEGQRCLIVGKDGNSTDLTVGRYAGLVSFTRNEVGIESVELGIYDSGVKSAEAFSAKGDSGWHTTKGKARIVGQLHSGFNKGGSTGNYVTYCTPGWYLLDQIRKRFKHADFYRTTWSA